MASIRDRWKQKGEMREQQDIPVHKILAQVRASRFGDKKPTEKVLEGELEDSCIKDLNVLGMKWSEYHRPQNNKAGA